MSSNLIALTVVAGPWDPALAIVVGGTVLIALTAHVFVLVGWLRRRP
jgi:hypothetical protein